MPVQGNLLKDPVKVPVKVPAVSNELSTRHSWAHQPQVGAAQQKWYLRKGKGSRRG